MRQVVQPLIAAFCLLACADDSDAGGVGPERPGSGADVGPDDDATYAADDSGTDESPEFTDFDEAWDAYLDAIVETAAYACPCLISFGGYPSPAACETDIRSQIEEQSFCYRYSLQADEQPAFEYFACEIEASAASVECYEAMTEPVGCMNMDACAISDETDAACNQLLTENQRASMDACAPAEEESP